ncbi:uncharacterized protein VTP21DRAFT_353 [Calcarisporiella thermophila]|uniref:uncharacterized protein n=1 Tax=Calcarisporiella thermophila TaxID=911321 RepID=UPI003741E9A5
MQALRRSIALAPRLTRPLLASVAPKTLPVARPTSLLRPLATRSFSVSGIARNDSDGSWDDCYVAQVQHPAPYWKAKAVVDGEFKVINLNDYKGKFLVMLFYPADFTFVCPTELIAFNDRLEEFKKLNCEVVGISVDNEHSHLAWINTPRKQGGLGKINYPLVSDLTKSISQDYGVLIPESGLALRGLFVIDPKQVVRVMHIHDLPIGRSVDETLRVIEAITFTDKHGEVCPANWKKGDKTIKPNPKDSKEYFSQVSE